MKVSRAKQTDTDKEKFEARERMEKIRNHKTDEDYEYDKIIKRQQIRKKKRKTIWKRTSDKKP